MRVSYCNIRVFARKESFFACNIGKGYMRTLTLAAVFLPLFLGGFLGSVTTPSCSWAESTAEARPIAKVDDFLNVDPRLKPRVAFWKLIFTRYGKNQLVFHHRDYPEVIYLIEDIVEFEKLPPKQFARKRKAVVKNAKKRITDILTHLSTGEEPRDSAEKRIKRLFEKYVKGKKPYKLAMEKKKIRFQEGIKEKFAEGIRRSGQYIDAIEEVFTAQDLPLSIARLPLVESSFNYRAKSSVGAAGIWQFMRSTARNYIRVDHRLDERLDPIMATRAAASYLSRAHKRLESWPLAISSYNHGGCGNGSGC